MEFKLKKFKQTISIGRIANIHYFEFTTDYHTRADKHEFCELVYVDNGMISVNSGSYSGWLNKNELILHKAGEMHSLSCPKDTAPNVIIIGFACSAPELDVLTQAPVALPPTCQKLLTEVIKEGRSVFLPPYDIPTPNMKKRKEYPFGADQMIKLKLETLFIELIRYVENNKSGDATDVDGRMNEIHNYISLNFREDINLDQLCFLFATNKTTICSSFKKQYGETIISFINRKRIQQAKALVRTDKYTLTEIAEMVGYSSVHYFCRVFKKQEGMSPSQYFKTIKSKLNS